MKKKLTECIFWSLTLICIFLALTLGIFPEHYSFDTALWGLMFIALWGLIGFSYLGKLAKEEEEEEEKKEK